MITDARIAEKAAVLPTPRGPLSEAVVAALRDRSEGPLATAGGRAADGFGEDLQLALYTCYELHYQGFGGVDPGWEWNPGLLRLRGVMERRFLSALRAELPGGDDVEAALRNVIDEPPGETGVSGHLREAGEWWQLREFLAHRSLYHLKEADPHAWVIPRLRGRAKAALVAVEFDEYGGGREERMHARLFADLMRDAGLDSSYGHYLDAVPAVTLATVNMISMFGLHRALRGALVGNFAAAEITTSPSAQRMADALERLGAGPRCTLFYTEHVEADAVHEQVLRNDVIGDLLAREPDLAADVVLGVQATELLESRLSEHLLTHWRTGRSSLR
ncbi:iron-containing redox enzyme family protein [Actinomadura sp. DC4]|uniref:iron-containing redox enzyme family protein n=1 Tax=Actinomadura sp. DC4 TaxID=3055069 RepID=UPI0025B13C48|nr:iron-containing redox enzyme family protein [Actinomadura sp. DC4]MDN3353832.1 iron-containing redox enzyme family protein [Actinomadura sp. DC4]